MPHATYHFPPDFRWGVATAAHQVEGDNTNNQWWQWEQQPDRIAQGHTSAAACNWWEAAEDDFDRAAAMNLNTVRLSLEWSRIEIAPGHIDTGALDRYVEMIQALLDRGIEPMVTLHHFSNPIWFEDMGGWTSPNAVPYFTRFVEQIVPVLRDDVTLWCTINEPTVYAYMGYLAGVFPPGRHDFKATTTVIRTMLKAHAAAYKKIHQLQPNAEVGLAHHLRIFDPARQRHPLDRLVAWAQDMSMNTSVLRAVWDGWWLPPLGLGPALALRRTLDWIGLNYYTRDRVIFDRTARDEAFGRAVLAEQAEMMDGGYGELYPEGIARALKRLARLKIPIHITENGIPDHDDDQRPRALLQHLHQVWRTMQQNVRVASYYHWTLTDNFEWAEGWTLRFGLIELDPETQARDRRPSADLYTAIAGANAITPEIINAYAPSLKSELYPG